jgi:uncharacterized membrane protein
MYFFDPDRGKRRRGLVRDQVVHAMNRAGDALSAAARDFRNRTRGAVAETRARFQKEEVIDEVLAERVRAELGRVVSHPSAISVSADGGTVTLSGPVLAHEADALLSAVKSVRGVNEVRGRLHRHDQPGGVPALQGGTTRRGGRFQPLQENWAPAVRVLVGTAGGALAVAGSRRRGAVGTALGLTGLTLLARGATNVELRRLVGVTRRRAVDVQKTININAPVEQVFTFFTDWANYPHLMSHVREVRETASGRTHWVVDGPAGVPVEWDAVVTKLVPNQQLAWKSVEGAPVEHAGIITFTPNARGGTTVDIKMAYNPPAGGAGHAIAALFRSDPKRQMDDDLARLKTTIERGVPPRDAAQPAASR